jgi:hypothetical protein
MVPRMHHSGHREPVLIGRPGGVRRFGQARPTSGRQPGADASGLRRSRREWSKAEQLAAYRGAVGERCHRHGSLDRTRRACRQRAPHASPWLTAVDVAVGVAFVAAGVLAGGSRSDPVAAWYPAAASASTSSPGTRSGCSPTSQAGLATYSRSASPTSPSSSTHCIGSPRLNALSTQPSCLGSCSAAPRLPAHPPHSPRTRHPRPDDRRPLQFRYRWRARHQ